MVSVENVATLTPQERESFMAALLISRCFIDRVCFGQETGLLCCE
jgi:hypothetical protein